MPTELRRTPEAPPSRWLPDLELSPVELSERAFLPLLGAVLALAAVLRAAHLRFLEHTPFFSALELDARAYDAWAQRIAAGELVDDHAFFVDPLYAYLLGGLYALVGHDLLWPRVLNAALGIATTYLVALIARRIWHSRTAALAAGLLAAVFVPGIHFEAQVEKTALSVFLLTLAFYLLLRGSTRALLGSGIVLGLCVLSRGNALALLPLGGGALALGWDREPSDGRVATRRAKLTRAAAFVGGALPVIALATAHNYAASHDFVLTTSNLGINLYLGNHDANVYGYYQAPDFLTPNTESEIPDFRAEAQRRTGELLSDRALSEYWTDQSLQAVRARPELALSRTWNKLRLILHDDESPDSESVELIALWSPVLRAPLVWFGQLLWLAALGAVIGIRRVGVKLAIATCAVYLATLLPFFVMARLRVPIAPLLAVLGGGALVWIAARVAARDRQALLLGGAIVLFACVVTYERPQWMADRRLSAQAIGWHNLGVSLQALGRERDAVRAYERAVAIDDESVPASLRTLGQYYRARGDYERAERAMRRVLEIRPDSPSAKLALRALYDEMLADPRRAGDAQLKARRAELDAPSPAAGRVDARAVAARAKSLLADGHAQEAIAELRRAVRSGPYDEGLHYLLGDAMAQHASADAMVEFFSGEVARDQKPQTSHYFWALGLEKRGDLDGAVAELKRALDIDPAHELSQQRWGLLLERQGQLEAALSHFDEAARILPDFAAALRDAARVASKLGREAEAQSYLERAAAADPRQRRRYLHWARYLESHGRPAAALAEVERMSAEQPADSEARAMQRALQQRLGAGTASTAPSGEAGWTLSADARARFAAELAKGARGAGAWLAYDTRDPTAQTFARDIATLFERAGWKVRSVGPIAFPIRPGLFFFAADDPPSESAAVVQRALAAAGLSPTLGTGYRAYASERRAADPSWVGFTLVGDQAFVLAIGRASTAQ